MWNKCLAVVNLDFVWNMFNFYVFFFKLIDFLHTMALWQFEVINLIWKVYIIITDLFVIIFVEI